MRYALVIFWFVFMMYLSYQDGAHTEETRKRLAEGLGGLTDRESMNRLNGKLRRWAHVVVRENIYKCVCQTGQEITKGLLERYDQMLMKERYQSRYRHKGLRQTTIKTVYGEVTYRRAVYEVTEDDGTKHFVYLF